ncbi:MAG: hypothetical protein ACPG61_15595 [Paracoccaceae bacterium]
MNYAPIARIIIRYIVGAILGMETGEILAGDPDLVVVVALGVGAATEFAYALAVKRGWAK